MNGFVKCAIATFNGQLSNPEVNVRKIKELTREANFLGVNVLVFPELCITSYTCQDLFSMNDLSQSSLDGLQQLLVNSRACFNILTLVGLPLNVNDSLYNCAVAIQGGRVLGVVPKQFIPNHNEFYEKRWFSPYTEACPKTITLLGMEVPFGNIIFSSSLGYKLGVEICEDLWSVIPPSSYLALGGANIIANLSASNELVGEKRTIARN